MASNLRKVAQLSELAKQLSLIQKQLHALSIQYAREETFFDAIACQPKEPVYVALDFETDGAMKATAEISITEVGAVCMRNLDFDLVSTFQSFVCPPTKQVGKFQKHQKAQIYSSEDWTEVGKEFFHWLETMRDFDEERQIILMAHNGKRFDARILVQECGKRNMHLPKNLHHADTLEIFRDFFDLGDKPKTLKNYYEGVCKSSIKNAHTALGDSISIQKICKLLDRKELKMSIDERMESFHAITKRCLKK